jgi:anion-transporting  ArsA/GET3 family ATPase
MTRLLLVAGAGGVGKTTVCGALGVVAASAGIETLVLTVDPAKRLAQTLGLSRIGDQPQAAPELDRLHAAMLDARASWEALVRRHTDPKTAARLIASRYFRAIADRFPAGQAYAVAESMAELADTGRFELIVVDTPPIGGGIDFFAAPERITGLVAGRALRILTGAGLPGRRALFTLTGRPALRLADRVLGGPLLADLADFLVDLRTTYDGVRKRAADVQQRLDTAGLVVVTSPHPAPIAAAERLVQSRGSQIDAIVANRLLPESWADAADTGGAGPHEENLLRWGAEARRQHSLVARLEPAAISLPALVSEPTSLESLADLGRRSRLVAVVS